MWMWLHALSLGLLLVFAVSWSVAINCYICDSTVNPKCANLTDWSIKPETCTYEKLVNDGGRMSWLMTVSEMQYLRQDAVEIPMVCQKIVGEDEQMQVTTVRRCQLANVEQCNFQRNKIIKSGKKKVTFCEVCEKDGCNAAPAAQRSGFATTVVASICAAVAVVAWTVGLF